MNKYFGKTSLVIAFIGSYLILNAHNRHQRLYEKLGELGEIISFGVYSDLEFFILSISQIVGIALAILSLRKKMDIKINIAAILICLLNFVFVTGIPFIWL